LRTTVNFDPGAGQLFDRANPGIRQDNPKAKQPLLGNMCESAVLVWELRQNYG